MEELYDTIELYLKGQLSDPQKEDFERQLSEDAQLREEVEAFRVAREVIEEGIASQLRSNFKAWDSESKKPAKVISIRRVFAVAASVAILIVAIGFWQAQQNYSHEALAANFYDDTNTTTRAIGDNENILDEALKNYQETNYSQVVEALRNIPDSNTYYLDAQMLLAQSYYQLNDLEAASTITHQLQDSNISSTQEQAEWLLLIIYLKEGKQNENNFKELLQSIVDNPSHTYYPKAQQLQKKLNSLWTNIVN